MARVRLAVVAAVAVVTMVLTAPAHAEQRVSSGTGVGSGSGSASGSGSDTTPAYIFPRAGQHVAGVPPNNPLGVGVHPTAGGCAPCQCAPHPMYHPAVAAAPVYAHPMYAGQYGVPYGGMRFAEQRSDFIGGGGGGREGRPGVLSPSSAYRPAQLKAMHNVARQETEAAGGPAGGSDRGSGSGRDVAAGGGGATPPPPQAMATPASGLATAAAAAAAHAAPVPPALRPAVVEAPGGGAAPALHPAVIQAPAAAPPPKEGGHVYGDDSAPEVVSPVEVSA